ncbi:Asp23/Gls24 family envelope stress response protein [Pseudonocardia sichuanensis]
MIPELAPPAERGRLEIHPAVLRKVVEHAADQVPGTLRHERRLAGIDIGEAGASARISTGSGDPAAVDVRLELTLQYPASVRTVVDAVRAKVGEELTRIAGRRIRAMTVTVAGLRPARPTATRLQ